MSSALFYPKVTVDASFIAAPRVWLEKNAGTYQYLLAHAEDGVVWGIFQEGKLHLSNDGDAFPKIAAAMWTRDDPVSPAEQERRVSTLRQLRLFGKSGEMFIWREGQGFAGRRIGDGDTPALETMVELQWLWGAAEGSKSGFTLMREGQQGFLHAPPVDPARSGARFGLLVRHYIEHDPDDGTAYIAFSRLVGIEEVKNVA